MSLYRVHIGFYEPYNKGNIVYSQNLLPSGSKLIKCSLLTYGNI